MIQFSCSCGTTLRVQDEHAGKPTRCPKCGERLTVPARGDYTAAAPPPPPMADDARRWPARDDYADRPRRQPAGNSVWGILSMCLGVPALTAAGVLCIP